MSSKNDSKISKSVIDITTSIDTILGETKSVEDNISSSSTGYFGRYNNIEQSFTRMTGALSTLEGYFEGLQHDENVKGMRQGLGNYRVSGITARLTEFLPGEMIKYDRRTVEKVLRHVNLLKPKLRELELYVMIPYDQIAELEYRILKRQHEVWADSAPKDLTELRNSLYKVLSGVSDKLPMNPMVMSLNEFHERLNDAELEEIGKEIKKLSITIDDKYEPYEQLDDGIYDIIERLGKMVLRRIAVIDGDYSTNINYNPQDF